MPTAGAEMGHSCQLESASCSVASEAAAPPFGGTQDRALSLLGSLWRDSGGLVESAQKGESFFLVLPSWPSLEVWTQEALIPCLRLRLGSQGCTHHLGALLISGGGLCSLWSLAREVFCRHRVERACFMLCLLAAARSPGPGEVEGGTQPTTGKPAQIHILCSEFGGH